MRVGTKTDGGLIFLSHNIRYINNQKFPPEYVALVFFVVVVVVVVSCCLFVDDVISNFFI